MPSMSLYTDGARIIFTRDGGGEVDRSRPTQVGRALERLGVEHIAAYSPQARDARSGCFTLAADWSRAGAQRDDTVEAATCSADVYIPAHSTVKLQQTVKRPSGKPRWVW